jgi:FKBP-type peptidyl-prolyl cis-trans isomerase
MLFPTFLILVFTNYLSTYVAQRREKVVNNPMKMERIKQKVNQELNEKEQDKLSKKLAKREKKAAKKMAKKMKKESKRFVFFMTYI